MFFRQDLVQTLDHQSETWTCQCENRSYWTNRTYSSGCFLCVLCLFVAKLFDVALARSFRFAVLVPQNRLARELDLIAFAPDALHQNLLAFFQLIPHVFHAAISYLRNV